VFRLRSGRGSREVMAGSLLSNTSARGSYELLEGLEPNGRSKSDWRRHLEYGELWHAN
jgi:hypothetical protein